MKIPVLLVLLHLLVTIAFAQSEKKDYHVATIAFYNVENLFDTENDPTTFDDDRTAEGKDHWTLEVYTQKVANMARVLSEIGAEVSKRPPAVVGLAEIENRQVVQDLVNDPALKLFDYGIVHYDSPDRRGIDVALIYQKSQFKLTGSSKHELVLYDPKVRGQRIYTRDQLLVSGLLNGDKIYILVNHWPSRSGGEALSRSRREAAAALNKRLIDSLQIDEPYAKIITMGDLNDDPINNSVKKILGAKAKKKDVGPQGIFNPYEEIFKSGTGTLAYRDGWNLFDQILLTQPFIGESPEGYHFYKAGIFNRPYLANPEGQYKGYPFRSFANGAFTGGYSDHFPVYIYLIKPLNEGQLPK